MRTVSKISMKVLNQKPSLGSSIHDMPPKHRTKRTRRDSCTRASARSESMYDSEESVPSMKKTNFINGDIGLCSESS